MESRGNRKKYNESLTSRHGKNDGKYSTIFKLVIKTTKETYMVRSTAAVEKTNYKLL